MDSLHQKEENDSVTKVHHPELQSFRICSTCPGYLGIHILENQARCVGNIRLWQTMSIQNNRHDISSKTWEYASVTQKNDALLIFQGLTWLDLQLRLQNFRIGKHLKSRTLVEDSRHSGMPSTTIFKKMKWYNECPHCTTLQVLSTNFNCIAKLNNCSATRRLTLSKQVSRNKCSTYVHRNNLQYIQLVIRATFCISSWTNF